MKLRKPTTDSITEVTNGVVETPAQTNMRLRKRLIKLANMLRIAQHSADHDVLTGLPNRRLLQGRLEQAIAVSLREHRRLAVLMIDLDGFKAINDRLGHATGDAVLQQMAGRLRGSLRVSDTAARVGGDEFVIMLPEVKGPKSVLVVIEKIRKSLAAPYQVAGEVLEISASMGVTLYLGEAISPEQLLERADRDMYREKAQRGASKGNTIAV